MSPSLQLSSRKWNKATTEMSNRYSQPQLTLLQEDLPGLLYRHPNTKELCCFMSRDCLTTRKDWAEVLYSQWLYFAFYHDVLQSKTHRQAWLPWSELMAPTFWIRPCFNWLDEFDFFSLGSTRFQQKCCIIPFCHPKPRCMSHQVHISSEHLVRWWKMERNCFLGSCLQSWTIKEKRIWAEHVCQAGTIWVWAESQKCWTGGGLCGSASYLKQGYG